MVFGRYTAAYRRAGRGKLEWLMKLVNTPPDLRNYEWEEDWKNVSLHAFDAPLSEMSYEERLEKLKSLIPTCNWLLSHLLIVVANTRFRIIESTKCTSKMQLQDFYNQVVGQGGEGVILRKPSSEYLEKGAILKYQVRRKIVLFTASQCTKRKLSFSMKLLRDIFANCKDLQVYFLLLGQMDWR